MKVAPDVMGIKFAYDLVWFAKLEYNESNKFKSYLENICRYGIINQNINMTGSFVRREDNL